MDVVITMQNINDTLCRTCGKSSRNTFPLTYTTADYEHIDFAIMLMACTSIRIDKSTDSLPQSICEECVMKLITAYIFKQQCERSDQLFRARLKGKNLKRTNDLKSQKELIKKDVVETKQNQNIRRGSCDNNEERDCLIGSKLIENNKTVKRVCVHNQKKNLLILNRLINDNDIEIVKNIKLKRVNVNNVEKKDGKKSSIKSKLIENCEVAVIKKKTVQKVKNADLLIQNKLIKKDDIATVENVKIKIEDDSIDEEKDSLIGNKLIEKSEVKHVKNETANEGYDNKKDNLLIHNTLMKENDIAIVESIKIKMEDDVDSKDDLPIENKLIEESEVKIIKNEPTQCDKKPLNRIKIKSEADGIFDENCQIRKKYKRKPKIYTCLLCGKELKSDYALKYHLTAHNNPKNIPCPVKGCDKMFLWEPAVKRHLLTHSNKKEHLCELCGKGYSAADSLRYHMGTHQGLRPHLCTYCGKTFKQMVHLTYHMNVHTKSRKYICCKCNRSYLGPTQLNKHWKLYCGIGKDPPPARRYKNRPL